MLYADLLIIYSSLLIFIVGYASSLFGWLGFFIFGVIAGLLVGINYFILRNAKEEF